jgi:hypothetical protein
MDHLQRLVRLLMLLACLVPFTSTRQAVAAFALPTPAELPITPAPDPRQQEEENEREEADGKEPARGSGRAEHHPPPPHHTRPRRPTTRRTHALLNRADIPYPADPFRNGLGTPYRC